MKASGPPFMSVVIPFHNASATLEKALCCLSEQSYCDYEVVLVDDCSTDESVKIPTKFRWRIVRTPRREGPASARNLGIRAAKGSIIVCLDSDCFAHKDYLNVIRNEFESHPDTGVLTGETRIPRSSFLGDCISELGFPGGGNAGFEKIWRVSADGCTDHACSGNSAIRRSLLERYGLFDESLPGAEDVEFSHRLRRQGVRIRYCREMRVWHTPRSRLATFLVWQVTRGRANYYLKKRIGNVSELVRLRLWSGRNIIRANTSRPRVFVILILLGLSLFLQQVGYLLEWLNPRAVEHRSNPLRKMMNDPVSRSAVIVRGS